MSTVTVISPRENLIDVVAGQVVGHHKDYSKSLVLFPGHRPVDFLHKRLAEKEQSTLIPPRAFSIDDLVQYLVQEHLGDNFVRLESIEAAAILFDIHLRHQPKLGGALYDTFDMFFPLGVKLFGELEEIVLAELPPNKVRDVLQSVQFPKFHSLWYYYENFYVEVERRGMTTRSMEYRSLADAVGKIAWGSFERIVVAGFYAFTEVERRIMRHLLTLDQASFVFQEGTGLMRQLSRLGIDEKDIQRRGQPSDGEPSIHFYQAPDTHGQVFGLAAKLKEQKSLDQSTVIVLPSSESLFPLYHGALPVVPENNYNISLRYPLKRTPIYGFFSSIMELAASSFKGEFSPAAYLEFMLHPYTKNVRFGTSSDATRIMVHTLEDRFEKAGGGMFFSLEALEGDHGLAERIKDLLNAVDIEAKPADILQHIKTIHDSTIRKFLQFTSVRDCMEKAAEVLSYIFQHSTAKLHPYFHPYSQRCMEALDRIGSSLLAEKSFADLSGYHAFLRHALEDVTVPFPGTPVNGVQVLGLLETRNLRFDTVYFLDATDDVIPGRPAAGLLLPQSIRTMLGLETYRETDQLKEYYFDVVTKGANEVHLFYTETQEGQKEKSRFVEKLLWKLEKGGKAYLPDAFVSDVRYRLNLANPDPPHVRKTPAIVESLRNENRFSTSQLDMYLKCPLKFYYHTVLGLKEREEISQDVDVMEIGGLVHTILSDLFAPAVGERLTEDHLSEKHLREVVERHFEKEYGKEPLGPAYFIKLQVMIQLRKFLVDYQKPKLDEGIVIEGVELKREVQKNSYKFFGKIDRVEKRHGHTVIIDYKMGSDDKYVKIRSELLDPNDRNSWGEAIGSFQLPMYMMLYAESTGTPVEDIEPLYLFIGRNKMDDSIEEGLDSTRDLYLRVEEVMFKLVAEIVEPNTPFRPTSDFDKHCPDCPYNVICGTQWTMRAKE